MTGNTICNNNAKSKYKNPEVPNRTWNQFQLLTIPIGSTKMWQYMCEAALGGNAPLKCIFISCIAGFSCSVVTCLGPDAHPPGPGDQFNNSLQREDLWGLHRWGRRSPAAVKELGGCVCDFSSDSHCPWAGYLSTAHLTAPKHSFWSLCFWVTESHVCLREHVGAEGSLQPGHWLKDPISPAFSVEKASGTFQKEGVVILLLNLHPVLPDRTGRPLFMELSITL